MKTHTTPKNFNIWVEFNAIFLKEDSIYCFIQLYSKRKSITQTTQSQAVLFFLFPSDLHSRTPLQQCFL